MTADDGIVIAIDGGGSKTDAVAIDLAGNVVARSRSATGSPHLIGLSPTLELVDSLIEDAARKTAGRPLVQTNVYLSGLDLPAEIVTFREAAAAYPWSVGVGGAPLIVDNDLFALLRAGASAPNAVAVVCGTGINCIGVRGDGATVRFPALGNVSGDWGGGWQLGEKALWHAARAADGRGPSTSLADAVPAFFGLDTVPELIEALHFKRISASELNRLSPLLFEVAASGDAVARKTVARQAEEVVVLATTAIRRLDLLETALPVVLGGGVLMADHPLLMNGIEAGLRENAPLARMHLVTAPPILGAALLALEAAGADAESLKEARAQLQHLSPSRELYIGASVRGST